MSAEPNFLDVKIMGREYRVACSPEEREALISAVELVDGKMRDIAQRTKTPLLNALPSWPPYSTSPTSTFRRRVTVLKRVSSRQLILRNEA